MVSCDIIALPVFIKAAQTATDVVCNILSARLAEQTRLVVQ